MPDPTFEPVGYRYRLDDDQEWAFASDHELNDHVMAKLAEKGWQVERVYRRVADE